MASIVDIRKHLKSMFWMTLVVGLMSAGALLLQASGFSSRPQDIFSLTALGVISIVGGTIMAIEHGVVCQLVRHRWKVFHEFPQGEKVVLFSKCLICGDTKGEMSDTKGGK